MYFSKLLLKHLRYWASAMGNVSRSSSASSESREVSRHFNRPRLVTEQDEDEPIAVENIWEGWFGLVLVCVDWYGLVCWIDMGLFGLCLIWACALTIFNVCWFTFMLWARIDLYRCRCMWIGNKLDVLVWTYRFKDVYRFFRLICISYGFRTTIICVAMLLQNFGYCS